jgi:hypothetical protein
MDSEVLQAKIPKEKAKIKVELTIFFICFELFRIVSNCFELFIEHKNKF